MTPPPEPPPSEASLHAALAERLKEAFVALGAADLAAEDKPRMHQRLIAITNASKHDLATAQRRLDAWFADLDAPAPRG